MKTVFTTALAALALVVVAPFSSVGYGADVIFFSQIGEPEVVPGTNPPMTRANGTLSTSDVPSITINQGEETTLHIWMQLTADVHSYNSVAWAVESSNGSVVAATDHSVANYENLAAGANRWDSALTGDLGAAGDAIILSNARAFKVTSPGVGTGTGFFNAFPFDQGRDDSSNSFYLGSLTVQGTSPGTAGLYFRTGDFKTILATGNPGQIQYGDSSAVHVGNVVGSGDAIDGSLAEADAIITVMGTGRPELIIVNGDPTGAMNVPFEGRRPVNVPIGGPAAKLAIDNGFAGSDSFFDVFFDVEIAGDSNTDLAGLMDMLSMQGFDVKSGRSLPSGPNGESMDYDFGIRLGELGGGGQTILDVDFGANGVTGVTINNVAVPEPSSFILAGLGCVVALGLRRRKSV